MKRRVKTQPVVKVPIIANIPLGASAGKGRIDPDPHLEDSPGLAAGLAAAVLPLLR